MIGDNSTVCSELRAVKRVNPDRDEGCRMSCPTFLLVLLGLVFTVAADEPPKPLAFQHITVIDCTDGPVKADMTVIVVGDRIVSLGKTGDLTVPPDARVIDASGKFMIPGLWDMHVHFRPYADPLFVANGVTGVRIMFGRPRDIDDGRDVRRKTTFIPDRSVASPPFVDESFDIRLDRGVTQVTDTDEVRAAVLNAKRTGFDAIKISSNLNRELYATIIEETRRVKIPFAGHVPDSVSAEFASDNGQRSIEHLTGLEIGCSRISSELQIRYLQAKGGLDREEIRKLAIETYDEETAARLFTKFVENNTWQCPTLTLYLARARADDTGLAEDTRLDFIPNWESNRWRRDLKKQASYAAYLRTKFNFRLRLVGKLHEAGVKILAGTDTANPHCFQGFGIHDELELLVRAGLSPSAALQTATRNPAEFLGRLDELGTVEVGKVANLVVLEKSPLDDIRYTRRISGVVLRGEWLPKTKLQQMLTEAKLAAKIANSGGRWTRDTTLPHQPIVEVRMSEQSIADEHIGLLQQLTELRRADLSSSLISDDGLKHLAELKNLETLDLGHTQVTDVGLKHLSGLTKLRELSLEGAPVSESGVNDLKRHLPNLNVDRLR